MPNNIHTDAGNPREEESSPPDELPMDLAEHLERNDDLCSSILIDQIGCERLKEARLGVHHQQVKFVGPTIHPSEVLRIIRKVIKGGQINESVRLIADLPVMREHIATKPNKKRRDDVTAHITLYLRVYAPTSRLEIWRTDRYTKVSGHSELGVYSTSMIAAGQLLDEIQGQCVDIPQGWLGDRGDSEDDSQDDDEQKITRVRRSQRTGRRDFSIIKSNRSKKQQLFLGPARFINHDCDPNVELTVIGKNRISFKAKRRIMIGEELTTTYGDHYFDKNNSSCMCLTCERKCRGYFTKNQEDDRGNSRATSPGPSRLNGNTGDASDDEADSPLADSATTPPSDTEADGTSVGASRNRLFRQVRNNSGALNFSKRHRAKEVINVPQRAPVDDPSSERCITCVDPLEDRYWTPGSGAGWDKFCPRCTRHALIFKMPWPAHRKEQVRNFPPAHLVPINYEAKIICSEPLPSLGPRKKTAAELWQPDEAELWARDLNLPAATKNDRAHWALQRQWTVEDAAIERQRIQQWEWQEENDRIAADNERLRMERKEQREREKLEKDKNKVRGSGVWAKYEVVDAEEAERKIRERNQVTSGTRSGRRLRATSAAREEEAANGMDMDSANNAAALHRTTTRLSDEERQRELEQRQTELQLRDQEWPQNAQAGPSRQRSVSQHARCIADDQSRVARELPNCVRNTSTPRRIATTSSGGTPHEAIYVSDNSDSEHEQPGPRRQFQFAKPAPPRIPIDLTNTSSEEDTPAQPAETRRVASRFKVKSPTRDRRAKSPDGSPQVSMNGSSSQGSPQVSRRGPGRPPGSGRRQKAEKRRAEREARERAAAASGNVSTVVRPSALNPARAQHVKVAHLLDGSSADEASPPSARQDEVDSQNSFSSAELDPAVGTSSAGWPVRSSKRPKLAKTSDGTQPTRPPRKFFTQKDGLRLPTVSVTERPRFTTIDEPPPTFPR